MVNFIFILKKNDEGKLSFFSKNNGIPMGDVFLGMEFMKTRIKKQFKRESLRDGSHEFTKAEKAAFQKSMKPMFNDKANWFKFGKLEK